MFAVRLPAAATAAPSAATPPASPPPPTAGRPDGARAAPRAEPLDDPFARLAASRGGQPTIPDLALEDPERNPQPVRPLLEPTVASRDPGLLEFGEVDLAGADVFAAARHEAFGDLAPAAPTPRDDVPGTSSVPEDTLAGLSLGEFGGPGAADATKNLLPPAVEAPPLAPPPPRPDAPSPPPAPPADRTAADAERDAAADAERSRRRLRAVGVNTLSVVALAVLAVLLFEVWRGRQRVDGADAGRAPAAAVDVTSGLYDTASGRPVVVVRGRVRAAQALRRADVRVELLDGGRAVAVGTATAGALPTPEEVHAVSGAADAQRLAEAIAARAPGKISAGEALPFTAVIAEAPAELRGIEVRVSVVGQATGGGDP